MKVSRSGGRVTRRQDLTADVSHGEAIGFSMYRGRGGLFTEALDEILRGRRRIALVSFGSESPRRPRSGAGRRHRRRAFAPRSTISQDLPRAALVSALGATRPLAAASPWARSDGGGGGARGVGVARALPANGER
jgi:hypothetical protein